MGDDDKRLFRELLADVRPLKQDGIAPAKPASKPPLRPRHEPRRERFRAVDFAERPDSFSRGGLRRNTLRRLRRGDIRPDCRIDLHGYTRERAQRTLESFLDRAAQHGPVCALVIHGKGTRSEQRVAVLRQMARAVLTEHPDVLAYAPARPNDGGAGAVYVYIKEASIDPPSRATGRWEDSQDFDRD